MGRDGGPLSGPAPRHVGTDGESVAYITIDSLDRLYYYYNERPTTVAGRNIELGANTCVDSII